jgi:CBS domain containing-hemolysin-like protein
MEILFDILVVLSIVLLNAFFVAAEFAIVKVRETELHPLVEKGDLRARFAKEILAHIDLYLSACQLGVTMASLALGWIGEPMTAALLEPYLNALGVSNPETIRWISFGVAFLLITAVHIIVGEQAPKVMAIQRAKQTVLWVASPLRLFYVVFGPVVRVLNAASNGLLKLLGIHEGAHHNTLHSPEELRLLLAADKHASTASKHLVLNAIDFRRKQARHAMIPRKEVVALALKDGAKTNLDIVRTQKFSRFPVFRENIDNIIGVVHAKDVFKSERLSKPDFNIESVMRDALVLPETAPLEQALETMQRKKTHLIVLADEYGGTAGIITLENVLEELVGNIEDEFDRESPDVVKVSDNEFVVDGSLTTNDVERLLNQELSPRDILSIGGFVVEQLGHIPAVGETLRVSGAEFTVEKVESNTVETVRVKKLPPPVEPERRTQKSPKQKSLPKHKPEGTKR